MEAVASDALGVNSGKVLDIGSCPSKGFSDVSCCNIGRAQLVSFIDSVEWGGIDGMVCLEVVSPASKHEGGAEDMVAAEELANGFLLHGILLVGKYE